MTPIAETSDDAEVRPPVEVAQSALPIDRVIAALDQTGYGWLRRVAVTAEGGTIILRGKVPRFYLKQMAQSVVLAIPGVVLLRNELQVQGGNT